MPHERVAEDVCNELIAMARVLWGEEDAERQRPGLEASAEQIVTQARYAIPVDLEPRFF